MTEADSVHSTPPLNTSALEPTLRGLRTPQDSPARHLAAKQRKRVKALQRPPVHPDAALIEACITFAAAMRGASGAFEADPTGDNDFAQLRDDGFVSEARMALESATAIEPVTLDGLRTKANIAGLAIDNNDPGADQFMKALARDVVRFHAAIGDAKLLATDAKVAS